MDDHPSQVFIAALADAKQLDTSKNLLFSAL